MKLAKAITLFMSITVGVVLMPRIVNPARYSFFWPKEYQLLRNIVAEIATANDLGPESIRFSIVAGPTVAQRANDLSLCRRDRESCWYYFNLNPFHTYKGAHAYEVNESIRQGLISGGLVGYVDHELNIGIGRSSFFHSKNKKKDLECLIAHELSHFLGKDSFQNRMDAYQAKQDGSELDESVLRKKFRRESEINADITAAKMLFNVGRPMDTCIFARQRWLQSNGYQIVSEKNDSYPGYKKWMTTLFDFLEDSRSNPIKRTSVKTEGTWSFNRDLNVLTFTPLI